MKPLPSQPFSEFTTRDIYLASVLKQAEILLIRVENHEGRGIFVFRAEDKIQELIGKYFNSRLKMDPKSVFETWKSLKSIAFSSIGDVR